MTFNNAVNYQTTNNLVLLGASNNGVKSVPSAVNGALISNGSALPPTFGTVNILSGGTNSTSYNASNGILTWNGTQFVNYSGTLIDSSGRYTNTNQPAFYAYLNTTESNITGDGTLYTFGNAVDLTELYDIGNNFDVTTGTFTAPVTGYYLIIGQMKFTGLTSSHTSANMLFTMTSYTYRSNTMNPWNVYNTTQAILAITMTHIAKMTAGDTLQYQANVFNGTKVVDILSATYDSFISARLIS